MASCSKDDGVDLSQEEQLLVGTWVATRVDRQLIDGGIHGIMVVVYLLTTASIPRI